ncbi:MAG TPA: alkaline phosphatase family protein [Solirubrobacterales bacterium]|nr:alkaline phosphatase family protein [Solirubrobacterales bacterium]
MPPPKKLVLTYVDSLRTDMLRRAVAEDRAPTFGTLIERGVLIPDCVSSFPSVTPVASAEMVTGVGADRHWISGMNWYHRLERRYVEYGSSLEATRAFGVFRALYDLVYNMNLAHLSPEVETVFESLEDEGARTACTPFLIYRGRQRHEVSLEGLLRRAIDATKLKFHHHTWGPTDLFYGDLYASREVPCRSTSIPGNRDGYAACCAAELLREDLYDFLLLSLPDNDHYSHHHGPEASVESIAKADAAFATFAEAAGGLDEFLETHAVILLADHSQTDVHRGLPLAELLAAEWSVLQPSEERPELAQLAVSPTGRAAHVYLLEGEGKRAEPVAVGERLGVIEGVDLICRLEDAKGKQLRRESPGMSNGGGEWAVVERRDAVLRFRPGGGTAGEGSGSSSKRKRSPSTVEDLRGGSWELKGDLAALEASVAEGRLSSETYPDPLARVWSALTAPHAGDFVVSLAPGFEAVDWGGVSHAGGGSHGALHAGDSLGPLLFVGCGPETADEREQWALRDVAPVIREHFGVAASG